LGFGDTVFLSFFSFARAMKVDEDTRDLCWLGFWHIRC
jgi:hypothetical protein